MKYQALINQMTLEEKAAFLSGKNTWQTRDFSRLEIPSVFCSDGPHGLRKQAGAGDHLGLNASLPATCFPTAATIANSWDCYLGEEIGRALGTEAVFQKVHILLGPGLNIKRSPLCGRNFEYFSEDPYLSGKMAAAYVRGIQNQGVYACPKHFAVNSQELRRMAMNAVVDERTLREIYLTGFEIAIKEGQAKAIMSSYNEVNGVYANENKHLLQDILRKDWKFDGIVITDWGASNDHAAGVAAGSNLEMPAPGFDSAREIISAVQTGSLSMEELDCCVGPLLDAVMELSEAEKTWEEKQAGKELADEHHVLARKASVESTVLLKNEDYILPLPRKCRVGIVGDFAGEPRYQGAGSSMVNPTKIENIKDMAETYFPDFTGYAKGYRRDGKKDNGLQSAAITLAKCSDVIIYCFGLDEISESEGMDREHMRIPDNQIELLKELKEVNPNIIGVLSAGSVIEMSWEMYCKGILHGYLGGQAGAGAMLELISGEKNPSGKLAETYPLCYKDTPAFQFFPSKERNSKYRESIFVGYRYYDTCRIQVQYPFGFGLSYTTFSYSELAVKENGVSFTLTNTGKKDGAEIAQLYVGLLEAEIFRPAKELKGFTKVFLKTGESRRVELPFDDKTFRYWNVSTNDWEIEGGTYQIMIGASSADIRLSGILEVTGTTEKQPYKKEEMPAYYSGQIQNVCKEEFEQLLGEEIPDGVWSGELQLNDAVCQLYYAKSRIGRTIYKILTHMKEKSEKKGRPNLNILFIYNMPFRGIAKMTGGTVSMEMADGLVTMANGYFFKGLKKLIAGYFRNLRENKKYRKKLEGE